MSEILVEPAFSALKDIADDFDLGVSETLLADIYAIQKEYQFDGDRTKSIRKMESRILAEIDGGINSEEVV